MASRDPWMEAMRRGDFEAAWRVSDAVLEARRGVDCSSWPRHLQFVWDGSPLDDQRVLVRCYHGLGDTIQFARLLAPLRAQAHRVILWVQPELAPLLQRVRGVDEVIALHDGVPDVEYDADIELMELPHALRLTIGDLPGPMPYLRIDSASLNPFLDTHGSADSASMDAAASLDTHRSAVRVGLAWRSGDWNSRRSIPPAPLETLSQATNVQWFSLQYPPAEAPLPLLHFACQDIQELARRMCQLDLIVSVDTMTAHLAGALALPVWTMLDAECDWRWMSNDDRWMSNRDRCGWMSNYEGWMSNRDRSNRDRSPWYPTMRLFRQSRPNDWSSVLERVVEELAAGASATATRGIRSSGCTAS